MYFVLDINLNFPLNLVIKTVLTKTLPSLAIAFNARIQFAIRWPL